MIDYRSINCPLCGEQFTDHSDIVVCPDCGAPYHRECYLKNAACLFAERHSDGYEWQAPESEKTASVNCPHCGASNPSDAVFCCKCGKSVTVQNTTSSEESRKTEDHGEYFSYHTMSELYQKVFGEASHLQIPISEWECFIGRASASYLAVFARMRQSGRKIAINFSAFLFGPFYFLYRKMWRAALVTSFLFLLLKIPSFLFVLKVTGSVLTQNISSAFITESLNICNFMSWPVMLIQGLFGHYIYQQDVERKIKEISKTCASGDAKNRILSAVGGVSFKGIILFGIFIFLLNSVLSLYIGPNVEALYALMGLM